MWMQQLGDDGETLRGAGEIEGRKVQGVTGTVLWAYGGRIRHVGCTVGLDPLPGWRGRRAVGGGGGGSRDQAERGSELCRPLRAPP